MRFIFKLFINKQIHGTKYWFVNPVLMLTIFGSYQKPGANFFQTAREAFKIGKRFNNVC